MKTLKPLFFALMLCTGSYLNAQWNTFGNIVVPGEFIGSTNNEFFDVHQNGIRRARFRNVNWPGYNGSSATPNASRMHFGIDGNDQVPFSMMHMGYETPELLRRPWMNVGTTYGAGADFMHVGLLQRPGGTTGFFGDLIVDAVVAWGCNTEAPVGPDNLRVLFLTPTNLTTSPGSAPEGLETMRITPLGNVGIGSGFSNALQPVRRLDVFKSDTVPQLRISHTLNAAANQGVHADFQVSPLGNLHIKPRTSGNNRAVAIGFLPGEDTAPIHTGVIQTRLDVGGLTRIRELRVQPPNCLITGVNVGDDSADNFLTRLDFPAGEDAECLVLNGIGEWTDVCDLGGSDLDWERDNFHVWTGHGLNGFPPRTVGIGIQPLDLGAAKLHVRGDMLNTGVLGSTAIFAETVSFESNVFATAIRLNPTGGTVINYGTDMNIAPTSTNTIGHKVTMTTTQNAALGAFRAELNSSASPSSTTNYGGHFIVSGGSNSINYGVIADAAGGEAIGVRASAPINTGVNYAGFFNGDVLVTGTVTLPSDESLKSDIQPLENATEKLLQLQPKSYHYLEGHERLNLSGSAQMGLIAQEVEAVLPDLVSDVQIPARFDSLGNAIEEVLMIKGMRYNDLIALLIKGFQEQQGIVQGQADIIATQAAQLAEQQNTIQSMNQNLQDQIQSLQLQLNAAVLNMDAAKSNMENCCQQNTTGSTTPDVEKIRLEQNVPNPFTNTTRIDFTLPDDAQVVLEISDSRGRKLDKLIDGHMAAGTHTTTWDGSGYRPGMYYYSLYANGQLLTKKMIKR